MTIQGFVVVPRSPTRARNVNFAPSFSRHQASGRELQLQRGKRNSKRAKEQQPNQCSAAAGKIAPNSGLKQRQTAAGLPLYFSRKLLD
ncbi:Protein kinase domain-containing protein [Psidium guajava]|nr:Protein kinase domain-containing protein [Psidium guajava]